MALVALIGGLVLVAGCGSDDSTSATEQQGNAGNQPAPDGNSNSQSGESSTEPGGGGEQSESGFVAEANAACQKRRAELQKAGDKVFSEYFSKPGAEGAKAMAQMVVIPTFEKELADLSELEPPEDKAEQVAELEAAIRRMLDQLRENPTADDFYPYGETEAAADEAGLKSCGRP